MELSDFKPIMSGFGGGGVKALDDIWYTQNFGEFF